MNTLKPWLIELSQLEDALELVCFMFRRLRPDDVTQTTEVESKIKQFARAMEAEPELADLIREKVHNLIINLRFLPLYSEVGILPRRNFASEFWQRVYDKILPKPPVTYSAKNLLEQILDQPNDPVWVESVSDEAWLRLYHIFAPSEPENRLERHLLVEGLYALEMLSIWLAAEEMEEELLRLDPSIVDHDSNFIGQEREISQFVAAYRLRLNPTREGQPADAAHAWVMLQLCEDQIKGLRQRALRKGSNLDLTCLLERLEQTLERIRTILGIFDPSKEETIEQNSLSLFRRLILAQSHERSITSFVSQTNQLLAKSITNHVSKTGEHYVTEGRDGYIYMLKKGLGAGVFIAVMALIKIQISAMNLSLEWETLWVSLNYGLGFVIIHMLHFTVATKQPAMTAAYIAEKLEHASDGRVNRQDLAQLIVKVGRSQFAAILGNVASALPTAMLIGFLLTLVTDGGVMKAEKAATLMHEQNPITSLALFYAAIAGIWLFVSGLVAGYFDNRCLYTDLPGRIRHNPLLARLMPTKLRDQIADYISEHYGALWSNFFFGVMLGVTGYVGYRLNMPLDIRHVAFSVANVGYSSTTVWPGVLIFGEFVLFALLIGGVNLLVSFILALNVAIRSRRIRLGKIRSIGRAYWREVRARPWTLLLPPLNEPEVEQG